LLSGFGYVAELIGRLSAVGGVRPRIVNLGGGFPWPYATAGSGPELGPLRGELDRLLAPLIEQGTEIWFESGRSLVSAAGRLLTTVLDVKQRGDRTLVVVDAGIHILGGMSGLGRVLRPSTGFANLTRPDGPIRTVDVVGPLCTPLDRLSSNTPLAEPRVGDLLCVPNAGGYASTAALTAFLSRPPAIELITDGEQVEQAWTLRTGHVPVSLVER
jgi:diaminopimelate decarboxylase